MRCYYVKPAYITMIVVFLLSLSVEIYAETTPVNEASKGVYRIWLAQDLTSKVPLEIKDKVTLKGYLVISVKGNKLTLFMYKNNVYGVIGHGSGFAINSNNMVTNYHVIEGVLDDDKNIGFIVKGDSSGLDLKPFKVLWHHEDKDLAILTVVGLNGAPLTFSQEKSIFKSLSASSLGFPAASDDVFGGINDQQGYFSPKIRQGTLSTLRENPATGVKYWEHNAAVSKGNSGGPLVNNCGEVVGVNVSVHIKNNNVLFAVALSELIPVLKELGLDFTQSSDKCSVNGSVSSWVLPLIMTILVALMFGLLVLLKLRKQVKNGQAVVSKSKLISEIVRRMGGEVVSDKQEEEGVVWKTDDEGRLYYYDPIKGFIYKEDALPLSAPALNESGFDHALLIQLVTTDGQRVSKRLNVGDEMTIGRSLQADLSINNSLISGLHLTVRFDKTGIVVTDLKSTNGSYIGNEKLIGRVPVTKDQKITLADSATGATLFFGENESDALEQKRVLVPVGNSAYPVIKLKVGGLVSVGRSLNCDYVINSPKVSGTHCYFKVCENGFVILEDNQSMNGTYVDQLNNRIEKVALTLGQTVYLADSDVAYKLQ